MSIRFSARSAIRFFCLAALTFFTAASTQAAVVWWTGDNPNGGIYYWDYINSLNTNWATDATGATDPGTLDFTSGTTDVNFYATGAGNFSTQLSSGTSQTIVINSLNIDGSASSPVTIASGGAGNVLQLNSAGNAITMASGAGALTISAGVKLGAAQTWANNSSSLLTVSGAVNNNGNLLTINGSGTGGVSIGGVISGAGGLTVSGGKLTITGNANTFTGAVTVDGSTAVLESNHATPNGTATGGIFGVAAGTLGANIKQITLMNGGTFRPKQTWNFNVVTGSLPGNGYQLVFGAGGGYIDTPTGVTLSLDDGSAAGTTASTAEYIANSGTTSITKIGAGTLVLSKQNVFTATVNVNEGLVRQTGADTFGVATNQINVGSGIITSGVAIDVNGQTNTRTYPMTIFGTGISGAGVLTNSATGNGSFAGPITLGSAVTIGTTNTGTLTLSGAITGPYVLTNAGTGSGTVSLTGVIGATVAGITQNSTTSALTINGSGANAFVGPVTVKAGTLNIGGAATALGNSGNVVTIGDTTGSASAMLNAINTFTYPQPITVAAGSSGTATISTSAGTGTYSGAVTVNKPLIITISGSANGTVLTGGITGTGNLTITNAVASGTAGGPITLSGGAVNPIGSITHDGAGVGLGTISSNIGTNVTTVTQNSATSALILSGTNTYTGQTTVSAGTLVFLNTASMPGYGTLSQTAITVAPGATLGLGVGAAAGQFVAGDVISGTLPVTFANSSSFLGFDTSSAVGGSATISSNITNPTGGPSSGFSIGLNKLGTGTLVLTGTNAYGGETLISNGVLSATEGSSLPNTLLTIAAATPTSTATFQPTADFARPAGTAAGDMRITGGASGFTASGANRQVAFGTLLSPTSLTWGAATFNPSTLVLNDTSATKALNFLNPINFDTAARTVTVNATTAGTAATLSGLLSSGSTAGGLTKAGAGTLNITNTSNSFTGPVVVNGGTLGFLGAGTLPTNATNTVTLAGATLQLLNDGAGSNGTISQGNNIIMTNTTANTLLVGNNSAISGSPNTGNTINLGLLNAGNSTATVTTLNITGANGYAVRFTGLQLPGAGGANTTLIPTTAPIIIAGDVTNMVTSTGSNYDTLYFNGTAQGNVITGVIKDASGVTATSRFTRLYLQGTNTLTLTGASTYTGATVIGNDTAATAGSLVVTGALGGTFVTVKGGGTLGGTGIIGDGVATWTTTQGTVLVEGGTTAATQGVIGRNDNAIGTLTIQGNANASPAAALTLGEAANNYSILNFETSNTTTDKIVLAYGVTPKKILVNAGGAVINLSALSGTSLANNTYDLITYASGSTFTGGFTLGSYTPPAGKIFYLNNTATAEQLVVMDAASGNVFWTGSQSAVWNTNPGGTTNFVNAFSGGTSTALPGDAANVFFTTSDAGTTNLTTTLGQGFTINSLNFAGTGAAANVAVSVGGVVPLTIAASTGFSDQNAVAYAAGTGLVVQSGSVGHAISAPVVLGGNQAWQIDNAVANALTVSGAISGGFGLTKTGTGTLVLSGANTFSGGLTVANGTVIANVSNATTVSGAAGPSTSAITLGSATGGNASLLANSFTVSNPINLGTGAVGTLTIGNNGAATAAVFSGAIGLNGGNLTIASTGTGTTTVSGGVTGMGNLTLSAGSTATTAITLSTASVNNAGTITNNGGGSGAVAISAALGSSVTGVIQNSSSSAVTLSGANTAFNGYVNVNAGTLTANTSTSTNSFTMLGTGQVNLGGGTLSLTAPGTASNQTILTGNGTTTGNNLVAVAGTSSTLTVGRITGSNNNNAFVFNNLTVDAGATLNVVNGGSNYMANIAGTTTLASGATLSPTTANAPQLNLLGQVTNGGSPFAVTGAGIVRLVNTAAGAGANALSGTITVNGGSLLGYAPAFAAAAGSNSLGTATIALTGTNPVLRLTPSLGTSLTGGTTAGLYEKGYRVGTSTTSLANTNFLGDSQAIANATGTAAWLNTPAGGQTVNRTLDTGAAATAFPSTTSFQFTGMLKITTPGVYYFESDTDDGGSLFIDGNASLNSTASTLATGAFYLTAGLHMFTQRVNNNGTNGQLVVSYQGPDTGNVKILMNGGTGDAANVFSFASPAQLATNFGNNVSLAAGTSATIEVAANTTLGALTMTGAGTGTTLNVSGTGDINTLTFTGATTLTDNLTIANPTAHLVLQGAVGDGGGAFGITKSGFGTLTLAGVNSYSGATTITAGGLNLPAGSSLTGSSVAVTGAAMTQAAGSTINGNASLIITNATSPVALAGLNTYTGATTINGSTVVVSTLANGGSPSNIGASSNDASNLVLNGATLQYTGAATSTNRNFTFGNATTPSGATIDAQGTGPLTITGSMTNVNTSVAATTQTLTLNANSASGNNTLSGAIVNGGGLAVTAVTKTGPGTWTLGGASTYTGNTTVSGGTLNITGSLTGDPALSRLVYGGTAANTIVNVSGNMTLYATTGGAANGAVSVYNQTAGTVTVNPGSAQYVASVAGSYGYFNLTGGTYKNTGRFQLGSTRNVASTSVAYIGGTNALLDHTNTGTEGWLILGYALGQMTVATGGTVDHSGADDPFAIGMDSTTGYGVLNLAGGNVITTTKAIQFGNGTGTNCVSFVNVAGGTLSTGTNMAKNMAGTGNQVYLNYAGGTLKATAALTAAIPASDASITFTSTLFGPIDNAGTSQDFTGGLTVDTNGFAVTMGSPLQAATGAGVTQADIAIPSTGNSGYIGAPAVQFSTDGVVAGGTPAAGYALISGGQVTGIVITAPGTYTAGSTPTITLTGGGGSIAAFTTSALNTANVSGGLIKNGPGTLTLSGVNTYTGATVINDGTLALGNTVAQTFSSTISGAGGLAQTGSGTTRLTGTNYYLGGTTLTAGVLSFTSSAALGPSGAITMNGGTLRWDTGNTEDISARLTMVTGKTAIFDTFGNDVTLAGALGGGTTAGLTKTGAGRLTLTGANTYTGNTNVSGGTLVFDGASASSVSAKLLVGNVSGAAGSVIQNAGSLTIGSGVGSTDVLSLGVNGGYGYYQMNGGTILTGQLVAGSGAGAGNTGVFDMHAGTVTVNGSGGWLLAGGWANDAKGSLNLWGGTLIGPAANPVTLNVFNQSISYGMLNMLGSGAVLNATASTNGLNIMGGTSSTAGGTAVNLNAGTIVVSRVYQGATGSAQFNFNGGTLQANAGANVTMALNTGGSAYVYGGGAVIDTPTSTTTMTISQPLLAPTDLGAASVAITDGGAGYIGAPFVLLTGGSGVGATAIAQLNPATGAVSNIVITSAGSGYQTGDVLTATLTGGGATTPATLGTVTLGANTSGGLTKLGTGKLTLSAANTYTGATTVSQGTLALGSGGSLGNTAVTVASGAVFAAAPGVTGATNSVGNGLFTLNAGSALTMVDGTTSTLNVAGTAAFTGGTGSTLTFEVGYTGPGVTADQLSIVGAASATGTTTINIVPFGTTPVSGTYTIVSALSGLAAANFTLGSDAIGFAGYIYPVSLTNPNGGQVDLVVGAAASSLAYWNGTTGQWNTSANWATDSTGTTPLTYIPFGLNDVYLSATTAAISTISLGGDQAVNTLHFTAGAPATTILAGNTLTINANAGTGITMDAGATADQTVSAAIKLGAAQSWSNDSLTNKLFIGAVDNNGMGLTLTGAGDTTVNGAISGAGSLTVTAAGNTIFNGAISGTSGVTVAAAGNTTFNGAISGPGGLTKTGAGTLTLSATNSYAGGTAIQEGTVITSADNALSNAALTVGGVTTTATLTLNANQTVTSLTNPTNSGAASAIAIAANKKLTVNGPVTIGVSTDLSTTNLTVSGAGTLEVNNTGGTFRVGVPSGATDKDTQALLDMSALATFTADLGATGQLRIGDTGDNASSGVRPTSMILAANSTITAGTINVGPSSHGAVMSLLLGSGTNVIKADTINLGPGVRDSGSITFNTSTGTLALTDVAGAGRTNIVMGNNANQGTAYVTANVFDTTGHSANLMIGTLTMAPFTKTAASTHTFSFDTGVLDIATINMAVTKGSGASTSTINIGGGTVSLGNAGAGSVSLATSGATGILNITGGVVTSSVDIKETYNATGGVSTLTLNGGTLDMSGKQIGPVVAGVSSAIDTLNFESGTLKNVAQINGGAALVKTTGGTLLLEGTNTYTGATDVQAGTLGGSGSITSAVTIQDAATLNPGAGATPGTLTIANTLTFNGTTANAVFDVASALSYDKVQGLTGATFLGTLTLNGVVDNTAYHLFNFASGYSGTGTFGTINVGSYTSSFNAATGVLTVGTVAGAVDSTWLTNASGSWTLGANWSSGVPVGAGATANFTGRAQATVTVDGTPPTVTVGRVLFSQVDGSTSYVVSGKPLTMDNTGGTGTNAKIEATAGSHTIASPVITATASDLDVGVSGAGSLSLTGGIDNSTAAKTVTLSQAGTGNLGVQSITNAGTLAVSASTATHPITVTAGIDGTGDTTVGTTGGATTATLITEHIRQDVLTIDAGSKVKISATGGASSTSVVNVLNIANASGSFSWSVPGGDISPAATGGPVASGAAVPEPATWLLAVIAALAGLVAWRRRK